MLHGTIVTMTDRPRGGKQVNASQAIIDLPLSIEVDFVLG